MTTPCPPRIRAILSVLETGYLPSPEAYARIAILQDGAGISYGIHQATDRGGNLDLVVARYLELGGAVRELAAYVDDLTHDRLLLPCSRQTELIALLARAGADPVMWRAQDEVLEERAWAPCWGRCEAMGLQRPLSWLVCYDTAIQSSPSGIDRTRNLFPELPPSRGGSEVAWVDGYLAARRRWLAAHRLPIVRASVWRIDELQRLRAEERWGLDGVRVLGIEIPR